MGNGKMTCSMDRNRKILINTIFNKKWFRSTQSKRNLNNNKKLNSYNMLMAIVNIKNNKKEKMICKTS